jgi:hypothetical protein
MNPMSVVAPLRKNGDPRDPARDGLREAIAARAEAIAEAEQHRQAIERTRGLVADAERRVDLAGENLEAVRGQHAQAIAASATAASATAGQSPKANGQMRAARAALDDAEDEVQASRAALETLEAHGDGLGDEVATAASNVHVAIAEVVRPIGEGLLARAKQLRVELECTLGILYALSEEEFSNSERARQLDIPVFSSIYKGHAARDARNVPLNSLRVELEAFNSLAAQDDLRRAARAALEPWLQWREILQRDPGTPVPEFPT